MTLEDFMTLYSDEGAFELIDGERIPVMPHVADSGIVAFEFAQRLAAYVKERQLGKVFSEVPFVLPDEYDANWVKGSRVPDVMFIRADRLTALAESDPDWRKKPVLLVPDLAVEVVSPTDRYSQVNQKVERYLSDGVKLVWVIDPEEKMVIVHRAGSPQQTRLTAADTLSGEEVVEGFEVQVSQLFVES
jgi:Uma2 family endonuclease